MTRKQRVPKTLERKLRDLDDHLYFLKESLAKLASGDDARLKTLTAELRVLACKASGTEGLLWRILDELHVDDAVHVHLAGNLDREHPLAQGLDFLLPMMRRAGEGDPRLIPDHYSLKGILKDIEALVVSGTGYTHEKLIRAVAEQMGSAHEDDGVEPHLIELDGMTLSDKSVLNTVLMFDAELILEVGERALTEAARQTQFVRQARAALPVPDRTIKEVVGAQHVDFEGTTTQLPPEGTVFFLVDHPHPDWRTNSHGYNFGRISKGPLSIRTTKHPDKTMEISIEGLGESVISTRRPIPTTDQPGVAVVLVWNGKNVIFYMCGQLADTVECRLKS
jgi:hypothetical protein